MKARVFVTLKPSVFDPQGRTIVRGAALARLRRGRRRAAGQVLRAGSRRGDRRPRREKLAAEVADRVLANPGHRKLSHRVAGAGGQRRRAMKFAVVVFPGSNCDHDAYYAARHVLGAAREFVWHKETSLGGADVVILPGGFSHGDYLRTGAIARFSPIMAAVAAFAEAGGPVLGICNGFQILLECGLLPGAMLRNRDVKFHCEFVGVRVERTDTPFTSRARAGQVLRLPIAHGEGNYYAPPDDARGARGGRPRRLPVRDGARRDDRRGQSERIAQQHRRHLQRRAQRRRPDAASRARVRSGARQRRRPRAVQVGRARRSPRGGVARGGVADGAAHSIAPTLDRHGLTPDEYARIVELMGREPNLTELGLFSVMWSEHCSYKSSRVHLRTLPTEGPRVVQGPGENAGAVDIGDGLAAVFKIESHNHPSFIEPYQGAATGVGGIIRDIFTMGARPIALLDSLRFGSLDDARTRRIGRGRRRRHRRLRQQHRHPDGRRRGDVRRDVPRQSARQRVLPRHRARTTRSSRARRAASAIRSTTSAPRPAATASTARRWRRRSSTRSRRRSGRPCRSAIRSWRSCCSRRASR